MYTHFWDEHVNGHHKHLATSRDPVSHEVGANLYYAVPKALVMTHWTSYKREVERLTGLNNGKPISIIHNLTSNRMFYYFVFNVALGYTINKTLGYKALYWQLVYSYMGAMYLESVNYLEHYGLRRRMDKSGIMESIGYQHSWSAVSSPISFRIQRHSDHHAHKFRPYQILRRMDKAPTMPFEYILMLFLIIFPPMYWLIIDPRVKSI
jgi:alkane 1-monooxygenase